MNKYVLSFKQKIYDICSKSVTEALNTDKSQNNKTPKSTSKNRLY